VNKVIALLLLLSIICGGCTENSRARGLGGTANKTLPCDTRLEMVTWKEADLWYLLRKLEPGETPRKYVFQESSSWGVMEGEIRLEETRCK